MRIVLNEEEVRNLKNNVVLHSLILKIEKEENKEISNKKIKAIDKARNERTKIVKKKIETAINQLRMYQKKITVYSVAKEAGISFNTAKKYKSFIES